MNVDGKSILYITLQNIKIPQIKINYLNKTYSSSAENKTLSHLNYNLMILTQILKNQAEMNNLHKLVRMTDKAYKRPSLFLTSCKNRI